MTLHRGLGDVSVLCVSVGESVVCGTGSLHEVLEEAHAEVTPSTNPENHRASRPFLTRKAALNAP